MKLRKTTAHAVWIGLATLWFACAVAARAAETNVETRLRALQEQNEDLQSHLRKQQELIDALTREVSEIRKDTAQRERELQDVKASIKDVEPPAETRRGFNFGKLNISGEGGVGFFDSGPEGMFPNNEFRVDEAKLFVDAPVWGDVYAFAELNLGTHEGWDLDVRLGEFYVDFENVSQLWNREGQLNVRVGRVDVPFGEEYLRRDAIDNPLVSHSLADIWGVDEGVELYGAFGKVSYVVAVQNGGVPVTRDFDSDKSVAGRISWDVNRWLRLSASGMRTGDIDVMNDGVSEVWFGGGWFRSISTNGATKFHANLAQGDVTFRLPRGYINVSGAYARYDDNDPVVSNRRNIYFYSIEAVHDVTRKLYGAARFSQIFVKHGYAIVGNGDMAFFDGPLVTDMWRLSLGMGYRWNRHLVLKVEYSFERGKEVGGGVRDNENLFAAQAAFAF